MTRPYKAYWMLVTITVLLSTVRAQSPMPYPNARTDRRIQQQSFAGIPPKNIRFKDPDFGSLMIRATDSTTNFKIPNTFVRTEGSGQQNEWSSDTRKFYVIGAGGRAMAFAFDPATMHVSSLPGASGKALMLPLRIGAFFSFTDPDLIYGTTNRDPLTITTYRFSTNSTVPLVNTRNCGVQPALGTGPYVVSDDDVSLSLDDNRVSISEGGSEFGQHMFVVVYDKTLGCRWYNTQTRQIGGSWGASGSATTGDSYLIRHAYLSRSGRYVRIMTDGHGWYIWNLRTLTVNSCKHGIGIDCEGYGVVGYNAIVNGPAVQDDMQMVKRPLGALSKITPLYYPLPSPANWDQELHFTWSNVDVNDSRPVCGSTHNYEGNTTINQPYAGEIFCAETDGLASTIWRFAHNRAVYISPYFQTQPLGSVSRDGKFFLFTSNWEGKLGIGADGTPRSDVFIVELD